MMRKPIMRVQPNPLQPNLRPIAPPAVKDNSSNWDKFKKWLKDNRVISGSLGGLSRLEILNKYKDALLAMKAGAEALGYGKKRKHPMQGKMMKDPKKLVDCICQHGGGWGDFVSWIKNRASDVGNAAKAIGNKVVDVGRRAVQYVRDKPVSALGGLAKGLSYIPSPLSGALSTAGTALGVAGTLAGKGQQGGAVRNATGKVIGVF
jgi:hypothetical protein